MIDRPLRAVVSFLIALAALSAVVLVLQQSLYAPSRVDDLTPPGPVPASGPVQAAPGDRPARTAGGPDGTPVIDRAWVERTAAASGVPAVALDAYARAELSAPDDCGLGWTTLAGIGWVESQHGTLGGRTLGEDGRSSSRILGPALDGVGPVAAIAATPASTRYHGDPLWDHAVGPMQFIPSTWETWQADGDGDGVRDPNDLDDAAVAAADYLCADGRDLTTGAGWTGGVLSYNRAQVYVEAVHDAATAYAERTA